MRSLFFITLMTVGILPAQEAVNQFDANGNRTGFWKKYYKGTEQVRYEGRFKNGKEIGLFKFYAKNSGKQPLMTKKFTEGSDLIDVVHYAQEGSVVAKGKTKGRKKTGLWIYFHPKSTHVMMEEHYKNGKLSGEKKVYYPDGTLTDVSHFTDGKLHGIKEKYNRTGILSERSHYKAGKLDGTVKYYDSKGQLQVKGAYKNGKRTGVWEYYKNGVLEVKKMPGSYKKNASKPLPAAKIKSRKK